MSLLLLFPNQPATVFCWSAQTVSAVTWTIDHYDFLNTWGEWEAFTWAQIESSGHTWLVLSGDRFTAVAQPTTSWATESLPVEACP